MFAPIASILAGAALLLPHLAGRAAEPTRPNVILIMTDDQGYGDLGVHGNPIIRTPHIDALAKESATLKHFYVSPVCTPTRAALMTGRYNYRTRAIDTFRGRAMMDPGEVTIAELLKEAGYATGIFGKWHLGDCYPMRAVDQGFEMAMVHRGGGIGQPSDPPGAENKYTDAVLFRNGVAQQTEGYCTDVYFSEGMKWAAAAAEKGQPFFMYLPTNCPHGPFGDVPPEKLAYYQKQSIVAAKFPQVKNGYPIAKMDVDVQARVYAMIENIDDNVGRLVAWLQQAKLAENTLVIFMTDNGRATPGYNAGMRGNKSTVYEGGIRSPFFAWWPGRLQPGEASDRIAAHLDMAPTILDFCGVKAPDSQPFDGRSLRPLLEPIEVAKPLAVAWPERTLFVQSHRGDVPVQYHNFAARTQDWKLVGASGFGSETLPPGGPKFELFDMKTDPYERTDVAADHPDVVAKLKAEYEAWFQDVSNTRPNNYAPARIIIGTKAETTTVLTRQDWRGAGWGPLEVGYWDIGVPRPAQFDVKLIFAPSDKPRTAHFRLGPTSAEAAVNAKATEVTLDDLTLKAGGKLEAWLDNGEQRTGMRFVELRRN
jgi:arylsulfatase/arylsulfatase A